MASSKGAINGAKVAQRPTIARSVATQPLNVSKTSQLAQLAAMTTLSIDTGDLSIIERFASSGLITDASE